MPYNVIVEKLKDLNDTYLQEAFNYILYLSSKQNTSAQNSNALSRSEAISIFKSFAGSLPQDFNIDKERDLYLSEKYGSF